MNQCSTDKAAYAKIPEKLNINDQSAVSSSSKLNHEQIKPSLDDEKLILTLDNGTQSVRALLV